MAEGGNTVGSIWGFLVVLATTFVLTQVFFGSIPPVVWQLGLMFLLSTTIFFICGIGVGMAITKSKNKNQMP